MGIPTYKPKNLEFLIEDGDVCNPERKMFHEWAQCKNIGIAADVETGAVE